MSRSLDNALAASVGSFPGADALRAKNLETIEKFLTLSGEPRVALYAEDARKEIPYMTFITPEGEWVPTFDRPVCIEGKEALRRNHEANSKRFPTWGWSNIVYYSTQDPNYFFVEADGGGIANVNGEKRSYKTHFLLTFAMRDGLILLFRENMNPLEVMKSMGLPLDRLNPDSTKWNLPTAEI